MKWTAKKPETASWRWWLPAAIPIAVLVHRSGNVKVFGGPMNGVPLAMVSGLWSDEPIVPDVECDFTLPDETGYYWYEAEVGQPPILVSVYQPPEGEPRVSILGIPDGLLLSECQGRWSKRKVEPPTEISIKNREVKLRRPETPPDGGASGLC